MKKSLLFLTIFSFEVIADCKHTDTSFNCVSFIKNYDGDTITVNIRDVPKLLGDNIHIRVKGIDTPEKKGSGMCEKQTARIAQDLVSNLLKNAKVINLKNIERDKYFRILADVEFDDKDLAGLLLKNKLAYKYEGGTKEKVDWCKRFPASK